MKLKGIVPRDISRHVNAFLARWFITAVVLTSIVLISYIPNFNKYGLSSIITGKLYHSYLDYPHEIKSADALELSDFIESLNNEWHTEKKTDEKDNETYGLKEIDVKDSYKRSQIIQSIAKSIGLSEDKFPSHSHHAIKDKLKNQIHHSIIFSSNHLHMNNVPHHSTQQCVMKKLNHHKSTVVTFSSKQYQSTHIKLDGLFSSQSGGNINFRIATPTEDLYLKDNIKFNLSLFAQSNDPFKDVTISQIDHEVSSTKDIHIKSHHILDSCLAYHLDITFPSKLKSYKGLDIKVNHAHQIQGDLESIVFKQFNVGLGRGMIDFKNLYADKMMLGTLHGEIRGHYFPVHTLGAASVDGATNLNISPQSTYLKSTVVSLNGPVKALIDDDDKTVSQSGGFTVHCWYCKPTIVSNASLVHVTSSKRDSIQTGYYKERVKNAYINVHSRLGESKLVYA